MSTTYAQLPLHEFAEQHEFSRARLVGGGHAPGDRPRLKIAVVSTVPPRQCGIATFSANLCAAMRGSGAPIDLEYVAIEHPESDAAVRSHARWRITQGEEASFFATAEALNRSNIDAVCVEHEFGLYGAAGPEYRDLLAPFIAAVRAPAITTLHTVLPEPAPWMLSAVRDIAAESASIVVMTHHARRLLRDVYGVDPALVAVIPHGVPAMAHGDAPGLRRKFGLSGRTVISTFGLVDPRKGLEFMIDAMEAVVARCPDALYLILGRTHPELVAHEGEAYRESLIAEIERKGLARNVRLVDEYLSEQEIVDYLAVTDIYVTPYLDPNQITSGTLAYALGAGKAIVSTSYLHAAEALAEDRGLLVGFRSAEELSAAVLRLLDEPGLRETLEANALRAARDTSWPKVGLTTTRLLQRVAGLRQPMAHAQLATPRGPLALASGGAS